MKKLLVVLLTLLSVSIPARAHGDGLSGGQGLFIGSALGWVIGRSMPPQQVIIAPGDYNIIRIPIQPNLTAPRVYTLPNPPYYGAQPLFQESWQYEPTCQCQVKIINQIGWR